jgi:hypothetical protein
MDKEVKNKFVEIEEKLKEFEHFKRRLDRIKKVLEDFWDSDKDCDDVDALSRIIKIMKSYNG